MSMENQLIKVGIHQPNFFPWLGYFNKLKHSDQFVVLDNVDIVLGSSKAITHRANVRSQNGPNWLTLPLKIGTSKKINEIEIDNSIDWKNSILNKITNYYKKSLHFDEVYTFIETCLNVDDSNLAVLNTEIIKKIASRLHIQTPIFIASDLVDYECEKNERLIQLIKKVNGNVYLSGNGGKGYNDLNMFSKNDIEIEYLNYIPPIYPQLAPDFINGLSIIDYLFSQNPSKI